VYGCDCTSFIRLSMGCSGAKRGCTRVAVEQRVDFHGLTVYESWIYEFFF
jgi:hypothetical protein